MGLQKMLKAEFDELIKKYLERKTNKEEEKKILDELLKFYNEILKIIRVSTSIRRYKEYEENYRFFVEV